MEPMKTETLAGLMGRRPFCPTDELDEMMIRGIQTGVLNDKVPLIENGYVYESVVDGACEATPACETYVRERYPDVVTRRNNRAHNNDWEATSIAAEAVDTGQLTIKNGYYHMTAKGLEFDGRRLLMALKTNRMFILRALPFHLTAVGDEDNAVRSVPCPMTTKWNRLRTRLINSFSDEEKEDLGLPVKKKPKLNAFESLIRGAVLAAGRKERAQ